MSTRSIPTIPKALDIAWEILAQDLHFFLCMKREKESRCTVAPRLAVNSKHRQRQRVLIFPITIYYLFFELMNLMKGGEADYTQKQN